MVWWWLLLYLDVVGLAVVGVLLKAGVVECVVEVVVGVAEVVVWLHL